MATPRVLILRAPGTNCDQETAFAFDRAGGQSDVMHINRLLETPALADDYQILCIPGGFSFGDDIAAGRIFANQIRLHLRDAIWRFYEQGKLIIGICNGFQVLAKTGLIGVDEQTPEEKITLTWNDSLRFEDRWVDLACDATKCVFLKGIERMYLPIAHAEGKFVASSEAHLAKLKESGQLALRYQDPVAADPNANVPFPANPNGSQANVAGICDATGRVFGLMPHPERFIDPVQHPRWTRSPHREFGDGFAIFRNAIEYCAS